MDQEKDDLVFYNGRYMPLSQALAFTEEDVKWQQDHSESGAPKTIPVPAWDRQGPGRLDARFDVFWAEADARGRLLKLLRTIQTAKQEAEIAEQQAKQDAHTQLLKLLRAVQKAKQDAEIARQDTEIAKLASWGFSGPLDPDHLPVDAFTLDQAMLQPWCRRKRKYWFLEALRKHQYLEKALDLQIITRVGYEKLEAEVKADRAEYQNAWKQKSILQPEDQLPEPNKKRTNEKSKPAKRKK
jgi:hypothetical protein